MVEELVTGSVGGMRERMYKLMMSVGNCSTYIHYIHKYIHTYIHIYIHYLHVYIHTYIHYMHAFCVPDCMTLRNFGVEQ